MRFQHVLRLFTESRKGIVIFISITHFQNNPYDHFCPCNRNCVDYEKCPKCQRCMLFFKSTTVMDYKKVTELKKKLDEENKKAFEEKKGKGGDSPRRDAIAEPKPVATPNIKPATNPEAKPVPIAINAVIRVKRKRANNIEKPAKQEIKRRRHEPVANNLQPAKHLKKVSFIVTPELMIFLEEDGGQTENKATREETKNFTTRTSTTCTCNKTRR